MMSKSLLLVFYSRSFMVLSLPFKSSIHFEFILVCGVSGLISFFCCICPVFATPFIEEIVFPFVYSYLFKIKFYFLFLDRGEGGERNITVWVPLACPRLGTWPTTQACALDWESNRQPFCLQAGAQFTEPPQPGCLPPFM